MMSVVFHALLCLSALLLSHCQPFSSKSPCVVIRKSPLFQTRYIQDGDIIIGGIFAVTSGAGPILDSMFCYVPTPRYYRYIRAFIYAIDEINHNPDLLPNVTLGYQVTDSCSSANLAVENTFRILSGLKDTTLNYRCLTPDKLAAVIGEYSSEISLHIAEILNLYAYTQISYGATDPILTNKERYPSFFQTLPSDQTQYLAIAKLLKHYGWTWIGVITSDDDDGDKQSQELKKATASHEICIEFVFKIPNSFDHKLQKISRMSKMTSNVIVICGTVLFSTVFFIEKVCSSCQEKTFIVTAGTNVHTILSSKYQSFLHGGLTFSPPTKTFPHLKKFLEEISHKNSPNDFLLEHIIATQKNCLTSDFILNFLIIHNYKIKLHTCNESIQLRDIGKSKYYLQNLGTTYQVYKAIYAIAHSLHEMNLYVSRYLNESHTKSHKHMHKHFLRKIRFKDPTGEDIYFNERGEMTRSYDIHNTVLDNKTYRFTKVGYFNASSKEEELNLFNLVPKYWKHGQIPVSVCSTDCPTGYRRVLMRGKHKCCFECVQCSEGEVSNDTDKASCQKCPEDQWPNDKKQCEPKPVEYLSYKNNPLSLIISIITILFFVKTTIILVIFILFRNTPIIKANNQTLSFILLVSIMLSFLCVFLFLGRPVHITCMLRHTSFGIIFSVAISCILARTITVYMAFKTTKPGSSWKKFIGVKITNCVVFICSFIQVLISIVWLCISAPFPQMNTHTYTNKIILECNEGSILAFSMILGYMGLLAAVSFIVAFLARNLPDGFNEAKYITFSMLVFCSVWVSFIPAYMSVTGKNTVLVEIFAIISSSIGILICIFFPKCYIILVRPDLNSKSNLLRSGRIPVTVKC